MTAGQVSDHIGARALLNSIPDVDWLLGDRGHDADWFREALQYKGIRACIPGRKQRKKPLRYDKRRDKCRNRIEISFGRLKDWRRVVTRWWPLLYLLNSLWKVRQMTRLHPLWRSRCRTFFSPARHNGSGSQNVLQFRGAIPFQVRGTYKIARLMLPYFIHNDGGQTGFADATLFNLTTIDCQWDRFEAGVVALLPTGSDGLSAEKWALGPAAGFVAQTE